MAQLPKQTYIYDNTGKFLSRKVRETEAYYAYTDKEGKTQWVGKTRCAVTKDSGATKQVQITR